MYRSMLHEPSNSDDTYMMIHGAATELVPSWIRDLSLAL